MLQKTASEIADKPRFYRPFNMAHYQPVFIENPCERPVEINNSSFVFFLIKSFNVL